MVLTWTRTFTMRSKPTKFTISNLPLAQPSQLLTHRLTPDIHTSSVSIFRSKVLSSTPSIQRRARLLPPPCHFSFVNPMPMSFPYEIEPPSPTDNPVEDKGTYVEKWLAAREAVHERPLPTSLTQTLRICDPKHRDQPRVLLGISETGLRDCLPHLDVGDAFGLIGAPTLSEEFGNEGGSQPSDIEGVVKAREELVDILSGHSVLMSGEGTDDDSAFAPWSMRYSGHQFGTWAGQLGDGRAISILVTPHPSDPSLTYELQLKGAGRTPFARSADGLAVLRSSIREYLCSEAMYALGIPTTRSLSLISLPALPVARERVETACVMTRVSPSFIRIGSFEAFNGPSNMFFLGGGQQEQDLEALRILGEWVAGSVLNLGIEEGKPWGKELIFEVARRNGKMVAAWQAYGFMHGVINTDNVSILGLTIDYGPFAFMDVFDSFHICNHTDETGRYSYKYQPNMIIYALRALLNALSPLVGAEAELGTSVPLGWAEGKNKEKIEAWQEEGKKLRSEVERVAQEATANEYGRLMRKRLGLRLEESTDESRLFRPLLDMMEAQKLDFHMTFRTLGYFKPSLLVSQDGKDNEELKEFIWKLAKATPDFTSVKQVPIGEWTEWLTKYSERIQKPEEGRLWGNETDSERAEAMRTSNPRFVLRQWVLEEVIARVEKDASSGRRVLAKVMHMACNPFELWGAEGESDEGLSREEMEERRFCGIGDEKMLGFQCSCSS